MSKQKNTTFGPHEFDIRVRERFLASGVIDATRLQKHLSELKDVDAACEQVGLAQPALSGEDAAGDD